ncbi:MAG TPA: hypothetical protein VJY33_18480, partial [Isosphaeraceae bacterium]|nr:hypothetical protein [Isosphaeraceae bacterium]
MWTSVVFLAASSLLPAQGSSLTLTNVRPTSGMLGTPRADSKYLPGDSLFLAFDIDGIKIDDNGLALYSIGMEVVNSQGKSVFKQEPKNLEALNALGGNRLPAHVHLDIGLEQPPGDYSIKLIVNDRAAKSTQSVTHKFTVLAKGFGLVRLATTDDLEGQVPATPLSVVGQLLYV